MSKQKNNNSNEVNEIEVVEPRRTTKRNSNLTVKTLKAWMEQTDKIINTENLLGEKEQQELNWLKNHVKARFIDIIM